MAAVCAPLVGTSHVHGRFRGIPSRSARALTKVTGYSAAPVTHRRVARAHKAWNPKKLGTLGCPRERPPLKPRGTTPHATGPSFSAHSFSTNAFSVEAPTPRQSKQIIAALTRWLVKVGGGLFLLELFLRSVSFAMRALGVTTAPLISALILLTTVLLVMPKNSTAEKLITKTLSPAVQAVDAQIACIFIPYICAVPVSNLPPGSLIWQASLVCALGTLATMLTAGKVAQVMSGGEKQQGEEEEAIETIEVSAIESSPSLPPETKETQKPKRITASAAIAAVCGETPPELLWAVAAGSLVPLALIPWMTLKFSTTAAPAYICTTACVYILMSKIPQKLQKLGFFPTVTGGVAMAIIAGLVGTAMGVGAEQGIRQYLQGAGAFFLYFVPPAVLGLAFRVKSEIETLRKNGLPIVCSVLVAVPGCMLLAAWLGRYLNLPLDIILASIPKCTTTGLAVHMAATLNVDPSLAAAACALSGTIGLSAGRAILDAMRINGPVARGVGTGASTHAAGTAALAAAGEDKAAAVSGVVFAMSGVLGVLLLEVPKFRGLLLMVAGG